MTFLRRIAALVAYHYEIEPDEIFGRGRDAHVAEARHMVVWLARRHKPAQISMSRVAKALGRDNSTIVASRQTAEDLLSETEPFANLANRLDEHFRKVGVELAYRITKAINAEAEAVNPVSHFLAEQNQRFTQAMRRETEAA